MIRISIPPLSEERREEMVKLVNQKIEQGRVAIRNIRHDAKSKLEAQLKDKSIGEDEHARLEKQVQDLVNDFNAKIDELQKTKDAEIRTV
jgi:ribosome recycling factor